MTDGDLNRTDVESAFSLLSHEIRLDILLALLDEWAGAYTAAKSYSELMDAVGMNDSGKFNYHLERLRGVYVRKTDDGYVPTASATALYRMVLAHRPTESTDQSIDVDAPCPSCGADAIGRYEGSFLTVACAACEWPGLTYGFPANGLENRTGDDVLEAVERRTLHHAALGGSGQCPFCAGTTEVLVFADDNRSDRGTIRGVLDGDDSPSNSTGAEASTAESAPPTEDPRVELACETCSWIVDVSLLVPLCFEPQVSRLLDRLDVHPLGFEESVDDTEIACRVRSERPLELAVEITTSSGSGTFVVDEELTVLDGTIE